MRHFLFLAVILTIATAVLACGNADSATSAGAADSSDAAAGGVSEELTSETTESAPSSVSVGSFSDAGRMTDARMDHVTVLLGDGKILTVGGRGRGATIRPPRLETAETYDPATGEWTSVGMMSAKSEVFCGVTLKDGRAMIFGGSRKKKVTCHFEQKGIILIVGMPR